MPSPQILVVGSFVQDLIFRCADFPRPGETIVGQFATGPGGKGSNQAVAAARAGGSVGFIGAVGPDAFGESTRAFHVSEGIDTRLCIKSGHPTATACILVNARGQNEIIVSLAANEALSPADLDAHAADFRRASILVTQLETDLAAAAHAMRLARTYGATVILNPAPMRADFNPALLADADILIPNETEFAALASLLPAVRELAGPAFDESRLAALAFPDLHALCRRSGVATVIVTLGQRGCFVSRPDGHTHLPAVPGIQAVDTTGAGDAFVGAFAAALSEPEPAEITRAARFANAAAALSVTRPGAATAMPRRAEIEALLASLSPFVTNA